jgi:hypothetical protein
MMTVIHRKVIGEGRTLESGPVGTLNRECERICHSGKKLGSEEMANLRLQNSGNSGGT